MTLCVVTRHNQQVQVATDSRLNWGGSSADNGVKVMPLELRLYRPNHQGSDQPDAPVHARTLGFATVGSMATTFVATQLLQAVFSSLQFVPGATDISLRSIADVAARVLRNVSRDVCSALGKDGEGQLVLVGRCIESGDARVFVLSVDASEYPLDIGVEEFEEEDEPLFLGSGAGEARRQNPRSAFAFDIVRDVIRGNAVGTVGGNLQFGILKANEDDFRVWGVRAYQVNDDRKEIYDAFYLGGLEVMGGDSLLDGTNFHLRASFLNASRQEVDRLLDRGYNLVRSIEHW